MPSIKFESSDSYIFFKFECTGDITGRKDWGFKNPKNKIHKTLLKQSFFRVTNESNSKSV